MSRPVIQTGGGGVGLVLVGILLALLGDPSITFFAVGLIIVGVGTVVLALWFYSALGHVEQSGELPDPDAWEGFRAPGAGVWVYRVTDDSPEQQRERSERTGEREVAAGGRGRADG
jgi:Na+/melibiose symporter-like transporter